ncbi:hypothetical protein B0H63DRAFT_15265 [Podospora didyma]|uniref:Threonine/serine exporter-like N-terminal domain-containing protein n=1 Tax=Podospora didyma TaxID=330526 RepID=A0AAE0P4K8_9PEZI|nr:hypothetical protein B0H63DRAFT_15265 [Podospora didyma]
MASQREPEDPFGSSCPNAAGGDNEKEEALPLNFQTPPRNPNRGSLQPPKSKEKKKVGFAGDTHPPQQSDPFAASASGSSYIQPQVTPNESQNAGPDYFSMSPANESGSGSTPLATGGPAKRESFNKAELTAALAKILQPEHHGGPVPPSKPRPVLRNKTIGEIPAELLAAAGAHRSEVEAKNRADRLAYAVGSSSVPASRRGSGPEIRIDSPLAREALLDDSDSVTPATQSQDFAPTEDAAGLRRRKGVQNAANELVRSHTRRITPLSRPAPAHQSGTATPVPIDEEYVPKPDAYKGGILGSLLKLYNSDEKQAGTGYDSSALSTPCRTPNWTPSNSPPTSRPGTPKPDKGRPGLRGLRSHSASTLAGLIGSSAMFAAPGSNDISEAVSEKIKLERERERMKKRSSKSKQNLKEFRITVHIAQIISRHQYLIKLCRALMMYGAPTHRLEAYMQMSARVLCIEGQFMYLPGSMIISFDDSNTHTTEVKIVRAPQGVDLGRLRDVHGIYKEVVHDLISVDEATNRLNDVINRGNKFPVWVRILLFGIASAAVAPFGFEGRYIDLPICFILGCMVGFLQLQLVPNNELYANVFEITASVLTSFLSRVFGSIAGGSIFCFSALAQSSIALILPGYIVLCASLELQSHQIISGSVRMVYALIYTLFLGYGITIGSVVYGYIDKNAVSAVHCSVGDEWYNQRPGQDYYILFVLPFTLCLCVINQAKWKQTPVMVFISLAGYCVNNFSSRHFQGNTTLSNSLGALCIGVLANLYSRTGRTIQNHFLDTWEKHIEPRTRRLLSRKRQQQRRDFYYNKTETESSDLNPKDDVEMGRQTSNISTNPITRHARQVGYGLAAAAMLPAIFVQVPSGLAVGGSLLSGVTSADQIVRNETLLTNGTSISGSSATTSTSTDLNSTAFNVLFSVIQVAISISVGLSLSALIVYPFGKRRSGLASF